MSADEGRSVNYPHQLVVRVSDALYRGLEADAAANGRTVAQSVRWHLRRGLGLAP